MTPTCVARLSARGPRDRDHVHRQPGGPACPALTSAGRMSDSMPTMLTTMHRGLRGIHWQHNSKGCGANIPNVERGPLPHLTFISLRSNGGSWAPRPPFHMNSYSFVRRTVRMTRRSHVVAHPLELASAAPPRASVHAPSEGVKILKVPPNEDFCQCLRRF